MDSYGNHTEFMKELLKSRMIEDWYIELKEKEKYGFNHGQIRNIFFSELSFDEFIDLIKLYRLKNNLSEEDTYQIILNLKWSEVADELNKVR